MVMALSLHFSLGGWLYVQGLIPTGKGLQQHAEIHVSVKLIEYKKPLDHVSKIQEVADVKLEPVPVPVPEPVPIPEPELVSELLPEPVPMPEPEAISEPEPETKFIPRAKSGKPKLEKGIALPKKHKAPKPVKAATSNKIYSSKKKVALQEAQNIEYLKEANVKLEVSTQGVSKPTFPAYLKNPPPPYPKKSRRRGQEGVVLLLVQVSSQGMPLSVRLKQSSGFSKLDQSAVQAVKHWHFVPAKNNGIPMSANVIVPIRFSLNG